MRSKIGYNIMSQSCIQGGFNVFSVLSYGSQLVIELGFNDVVTRSVYHIRLPQGFFTLECIISKCVLIGKYFVMNRFM